MIERPKRAVTRFFIPLIDVLILLFCIFLLMPFMNQPTSAEPSDKSTDEQKKRTPEEMRKEMAGLRIDLDRARREVKKLQDDRKDPSEKFSVLVLDIDPKGGQLFYYREGKRLDVGDQRTAQDVIDEHKRRGGLDKEPFFVILLPRVESGFPDGPQLKKYHHWFREVPHRFDSPYGALPREFEEKR